MPEYLFPDRNEYLDKYLFPFEKGEELEETGTQYFELTISIGKFLTDNSYISSLAIPVDIKYCVLDVKFDMEKYNITTAYNALTGRGEFEILEKINTMLDTILPHNQIEYLYCGFQLKNIATFTNLKTLILERCDIYYSLDDLPASLIRLEIFADEFNHKLDNLPPNLKILRIDTGGIGYYCSGYPEPLDNLPQGLEILYFPETISMDGEDLPANFDNLPSGLKYLYLPPHLSAQTYFNAIPDTVEVIEFHHYPTHVNKITKYPKSLKKVYTNCNILKTIEPLSNYMDRMLFETCLGALNKDLDDVRNCLTKNGYLGKFKIYTNTADNSFKTKEYRFVSF